MGKNNVLIYTEWLEDLEDIGDMESGILFQNILRYQIGNMDLLPMERTTNIVFKHIKRCIDRDNAKYEAICERNRLNGEKGGRPKNPKNPSGYFGNPTEPKKPDNENDNDKDNDNENEKDKDKDNDNENEKDKDKDIKEKEKGKVTRKRTTKNKTIYDIDLIEREVLCNKIAYPRQG